MKDNESCKIGADGIQCGVGESTENMNEAQSQLLDLYLQPTPAPRGMTSREIVRRAIEFDDPPRIPYSFISPLESDFFETAILGAIPGAPGAKKPPTDEDGLYRDEWGVGHKVTGRAWDHACEHPLEDLRKLKDYRFPDVAAPDRFDAMRPYVEKAGRAGKYVVGFDPVLMFERMRALVGFEELMVAPYTQPDGLEALLDLLADISVAAVEQWARIGGVHGYMTWEDWGLQTSMQMNPETFRRLYKPRYARIAEAAHRAGMHYIWHNCGWIFEMIPDMIEIGVDVVQLDQPRLMGHRKLADAFGGKICFWNTLDIQWTAQEDLAESDIDAEAAEMAQTYGAFGGGLIARHYPQPRDIGMSSERLATIYDAFMRNGCGLPSED